MFCFFKEVYFTLFTICFRVGGSDWSSNVNAGKGVACVALIESAFIMAIALWIDMLGGASFRVHFPKWALVSIFFALCIANHYPLVVCCHGLKFEREFNKLKPSKRLYLLASSSSIITVAIAFFIYSGLAYRRFIGVD